MPSRSFAALASAGSIVLFFACAKNEPSEASFVSGGTPAAGGVRAGFAGVESGATDFATSGGQAPTGGSNAAGGTTGAGAVRSGGDAEKATSMGGLGAAGGSAEAGRETVGAGRAGANHGGSSNLGAGGAAHSGGRAAEGGTQAAGAGGDGGDASGGCSAELLLCEDFEATVVGGVPSGWVRHGSEVAVADDTAHGGRHALKIGATAASERRIYHSAALLGSAHWGRIFYKVAVPVPDAFVHSTMVSLTGTGPANGDSDYRPIDTVKQAKDTRDVGGRHNFIYNVQIIGGSEFGRETAYDYTFDGKWHCAEYHLDASNQSYALYLDGEQILAFENGPGKYDRSDIPDGFDQLRVGWINYQSAPPGFNAWLDDIAFDDARVGCD